jgi:hypothetical protein
VQEILRGAGALDAWDMDPGRADEEDDPKLRGEER